MMIPWVIYTVAIGLVLCLAGACAETALARIHVPRRVLWVGVIGVVLSLTCISLVRRSAVGTSRSVEWNVDVLTPSPLTSSHRSAASESTGVSGVVSDKTQVAGLEAYAAVDAFFVVGWVLASGCCFLAMSLALWRLARVRRRWPRRLVGGTTVLLSADVGPAVVGFVRQEIVVPTWFLSLDVEAQRMGITHELEHMRSRDPWLLWAALLSVALMPWNISLWYAVRRLRQAMEIDCDHRVLCRRIDTHAYCSLLLDVSERTHGLALGITALSAPVTSLERRINAMTYQRRTRWRAPVSGTAAALLVLAACQAPQPAVSGRTRASVLAGELSALLATDTGRRALTDAKRRRLRESLQTSATGSHRKEDELRVAGERLRLAGDLLRGVGYYGASKVSMLDSVVNAAYPGLVSRHDTTLALVAVILDPQGRVKRHASRTGGQQIGSLATLVQSLAVDTLSARTQELGVAGRPQWHLNVMYAVEADGPPHGKAALRGRIDVTK